MSTDPSASTLIDRTRYSRQLLFTPIGESGQERLKESRVTIVGMGALGTVLSNHMVRAGVGFVRLIDRDFVEPSNLQRQLLYDEEDARLSRPKAIAAAERLRRINSSIQIEPHVVDLHPANAEELLVGSHLVLDGTDNFSVRFLINDVCVKHSIPWVYGGAVRSRGAVMAVIPGETPCLRCLFPQQPENGSAETCDTAGVISPIIDIVASYQAAEALKILTGNRQQVNPSMLHLDIWHNISSGMDMSKARRPDCPCCGQSRFEYLWAEAEEETIQSLCGRDTVQIHPVVPRQVDLQELERRFSILGEVERTPYLLKFKPDANITLVMFPDGRTLIQGISDTTSAKNLYSRYIGM